MRKFLTVLLCACLFVCCCACGGSSYRIIDTFSAEGSYVVAYRQGDRLGEIMTAAMKELADSGVLRSASQRWFGENLVCLRGEKGALDALRGEIHERTVIVGVDITNMPMSYEKDGGYLGFDVDVANYVCSYLGWSMQLYPIDPTKAEVELQSGNVDVVMGVPQTDEMKTLDYSPPYLTSRYVLVARVTGSVRDRNAMKGKTLGVAVTDLEVLQTDQKFVDSLGAVTYQTNTDGLFQALLNRDVDGILVSSVVAAYYMNLG